MEKKVRASKLIYNDNGKQETATLIALDQNNLEIENDQDKVTIKLTRISDDIFKAAQVQAESVLNNWQPAVELGTGSQIFSCVLNQIPEKTINRCGTPRKHGGEVLDEKANLRGQIFSVWAAPQTYEQLYVYDCVDSCGKKRVLIGDVSWDCVAPQELAATGIELPIGGSDNGCSTPSFHDLGTHFRLFIKKKFQNESLRPYEMPPPSQGINYWQVDK